MKAQALWTVRDLAQWARLSESRIYELVREGLPHLRAGGSIRFEPARIREHFERVAAERLAAEKVG